MGVVRKRMRGERRQVERCKGDIPAQLNGYAVVVYCVVLFLLLRMDARSKTLCAIAGAELSISVLPMCHIPTTLHFTQCPVHFHTFKNHQDMVQDFLEVEYYFSE